MKRRTAPRILAALGLVGAILLGSCGKSVDNRRVRVTVIEDNPGAYRVSGAPLRTGPAMLRAAVAQGLVSFGSDGEIRPALAQRWIVTDDGLSYIFRLADLRWNDGGTVDAAGVAVALRARMRELRGSRFAGDLAAIKQVVPMTGDVIEVRLTEIKPSLLNILAQPELGLVYDGAGSGPLKALALDGVTQLKHRSPAASGEATLKEPLIAIADLRPAEAMIQFANGQSDLVVNGRFQHLALLEASDVDQGRISFDPVTGLFGLLVVHQDGFLSQPENREAIAMAIDRPKMLTAFEKFVWRESTTISPIELQNRARIGRPSWAALDNPTRQKGARARVAEWIATHGPVQPLRVAMQQGAGARILFAYLKADLNRIGLDARQVKQGDAADLMLIDEVADYDSPLWYLSRLSCHRVAVCSKEADALQEEARAAETLGKRKQLLGEAERLMTVHSGYIPIAMPVRFALVRNGLKGFQPNYRGWHNLQFLGELPD